MDPFPAPAPYPGGPPTFAFPPVNPYLPVPPSPDLSSPESRAADATAISYVANAALLGVIGFVVSIILVVGVPLNSELVNVATDNGSLAVSGILVLSLVLLISLALAVVELWLYRRAFGTLAWHDTRFSGPRTYALCGIIGVILLSLAFVALFAVVATNSCNSMQGSPSCTDLGPLLGALVFLAAAAIVTLVGVVGVAVGIWRLGTRYNEDLFKAGAILLFFLNIVGVVLILIAARSVSRRVRGTPMPTAFG